MNPSIFVLFSALSMVAFLPGCATAPTPAQETMINSGVRIATMAFILKGGTPQLQQTRAVQVMAVTAQVRQHILTTGQVVPDLNVLAAWANAQILANKGLSSEDKQLLQAVVLEAIFLAEDSGLVVGVDIGVENAARILKGLDQVDRVARTLIGS